MSATIPTARTAHPFLEFRDDPSDMLLSLLCSLNGDRPANPFVAGQDRLSKPTRPLSHRCIFEIHDARGGRAMDEFSGKSAPDIILLNCSPPSRNETPQPGSIARRVSIACDNSRAENRQALEADTF